MNKFYDTWKDRTSLEKQGIEALEKAVKILFENIPPEKIVAIYVKGSFVNREMNEKSDVDMVPIAIDNETLLKIVKLEKEKGGEYRPAEFLPFSIWELEHNERHAKYETLKGRPDLFLADLEHHKLIYGTPLDVSKFPMRSDQERLNALRSAVQNIFIPGYREGKVGIGNLAKFTLWLTYLEQKLKGIKSGHGSRAIADSVSEREHIVHRALELRLNPNKDEEVREAFVQDLTKHLENLGPANSRE